MSEGKKVSLKAIPSKPSVRVQGDAAWEKVGKRLSQAEFEEILALRKKSETQILSSQERNRLNALEEKRRTIL